MDLRIHHRRSWAWPVVGFALTFGLWLLSLAVGLSSESEVVRLVMAVPLTLASAQLFMLGHDAGHRSFSPSTAVNEVVGRLAFVPSLHVFGLWRMHHDVHHRYTNLRGRDFVWTPLSVADYRALPRWRRVLHRVHRHRSGVGLGLHYTTELWAGRMLWPGRDTDRAQRRRLKVDALVLFGMVAGLGLSAWVFVRAIEPHRAGDVSFWLWGVLVLFVVPLLGTHWLIGFVIYLNHTHPDIVWFDDPAEWSRHRVDVEGSTDLRFAPVRQALAPRRIMHHAAHHIDPGVPLSELGTAQRQLRAVYGDRIVSYDWSRREFRRILSACKLYDYDARRWLTYAAIDDEVAR